MNFKYVILRAALIAAFSISLTLPGRAETPAQSYEAQATQTLHLLEGARYGEAIDAAQALMTQDPNAAPSYQLRGMAALYVGDLRRAQADWDEAAKRAPDDPATEYGRAICALLWGHPAEAQTAFAQARQAKGLTDAQAADLDTALAYESYLRGDLAGAQTLAEKSPAPDDAVRQELLALVAVKQNAGTGVPLLQKFLATPNGVPQVREAEGLRARFEADPLPVESAVIAPALQHMFATRIDNAIADTVREAGQTVKLSGVATLTADVAPAPQIAFVTFAVDGQMVSMVNTVPYVCSWNTARTPNGWHSLRINVVDASGNVLSTQTRQIGVFNAGKSDSEAAHGGLSDAAYQALETRLWALLRLRPARKVAEWTLAEAETKLGNMGDANLHRMIAAALDPDYKDGRQAARALFSSSLAGGTQVASAKPISLWRGDPSRKEVALTFDDGPNAVKTPLLLDALDKADAPATFFVVGSRAELTPDLLKRMAKRGDNVENHSYTHPNMSQVIPSVAESEILRTNVIIRALTGHSPRFFRPPGGNITPDVTRLLRAYGLSGGFWTVDALHAEDEGSAQGLINYVVAHIHPGSIVLMHNGTDCTIQAVPGLAAALRAKGYKLVTLEKLTPSPTSEGMPKGQKMRE